MCRGGGEKSQTVSILFLPFAAWCRESERSKGYGKNEPHLRIANTRGCRQDIYSRQYEIRGGTSPLGSDVPRVAAEHR